MTDSESTIESLCEAVAVRFGGKFYKFAWVGRRGGPDRILVLPFRSIVFVELKTHDGRQSPLQRYWEQELIGLGQRYWLVRSAESFELRIRDFVAHEIGLEKVCKQRERRSLH